MEIEIKLNVKPTVDGGLMGFFTELAARKTLAGYPLGDFRQLEIRDLYYDTPDGALAKNGAGLRSRLENGKAYLTLKIHRFQDGAMVGREEFEEPLEQERVDWVLSHVKEWIGDGPFPAQAFYEGKECGNLAPVLKVETARVMRPVGRAAALALDVVKYPGVAVNPYFDIEVEALEGAEGERCIRDVETELNKLAKGHLAPATESKLSRGLKLKARADEKKR